jgi:hypothetical protein
MYEITASHQPVFDPPHVAKLNSKASQLVDDFLEKNALGASV